MLQVGSSRPKITTHPPPENEDPDLAQLKKKNPDPTLTLIQNEEKIIFMFLVGRHKIRSYKPSF